MTWSSQLYNDGKVNREDSTYVYNFNLFTGYQ